MAKPNYSGEKRQKELKKQRKKEAKKQRKLDNALAPKTGDASEADFNKARAGLSGVTEDLASEVPPGDEDLTNQGEVADLRGHAVDTSPPDQDVDVGLELVEEGVDEADTDQRRAAKDEDRSELA